MKQLNNETISNLKTKALREIKNIQIPKALENLHIKYLGRKGKINLLLKEIPKLSPETRKQIGQLLNKAKEEIENALQNRLRTMEQSASSADKWNNGTTCLAGRRVEQWLDITAPAIKPSIGHLHLITQAIREISEIFEKIGFVRVSYPEIEYDWYAFEGLNMPKNHPARDEWETFFVDLPAHPKLGEVVLTPHTSSGQLREMERLKKPPIRMINIAKCFRRQSDATHTPMFHQFEGLVVDKNISLADLKGVMDYFARRYYGEEAESRIRPFHFQFTEPSVEVDFSCVHCQKRGCRFCKGGWHEVGGAGMVHPKALKNGGLDPKKYTGFAFGWGVERVLCLKPGLNIDDIRTLYSTDLRILEQF